MNGVKIVCSATLRGTPLRPLLACQRVFEMKTKTTLVLSAFVILVSLAGCARPKTTPLVGQSQIVEEEEPVAESAPPDAYLNGSPHPYYGSENPWDRRFFTRALNLYGRRGQRQMLDIIEGRTEEAAKYCRELLAKDPNDLESLFNLAVAEAWMGDLNTAMGAVKQAVDRGLPLDRFLVGPRQVLRPLTESEAFQQYASSRKVELAHGPLLGSVTTHSARFWVRTIDEVPVQVVCSASADLSNPIRSEVRRTEAAADHTAIVEVQGLQPATAYHYDLMIDGKPMLAPNRPSFRTYPIAEARVRFQVAFGGGAGYNPPCERMWDLIRSYKPDAFLAMGDNVYMDLPAKPNGFVEYTYYRRQCRPEFRRLVSSVPVYAIWDDHDSGMDDDWLGPYKDKPDWKLPLFRNFRQQWNNPDYGDPEWPGCWFNFSIGPVEFFMLECRMYRTNPFDKHPTMLGPVQKAWLRRQLQQSTAQFKVIVSSVPWTLKSKGGARDTWNGFQEERQEIFDFLSGNKINGVVLLSADRHRTEVWRDERPNGYPLYEFESSRLTNEHVHELVPGTLFGYNAKQSFGLLTFDLTGADLLVTFQGVSIDDEIVGTVKVKLSEISD